MFAKEFTPAGTLFWEYLPDVDLAWSKEEFVRLPETAQQTIRHYGYLDKGSQEWRLGFDNDRFMNHSDNPNIIDKDGKVVVGRDIQAGEEITCDYRVFDDDWEWKLRAQD